MKWMAAPLLLLASLLSLAGEDPEVSRSERLTLKLSDYIPFLQLLTPGDRRHLAENRDALREFVLDFHSDADLAALAETEGLDRDPKVQAELELARRKVLVEALMRKVLSEAKLPDFTEMSRERYELQKERFRVPEKRKVAHIFITERDRCPCRPEDKRPAEEIAREVVERLRKGEDFAEMAARFSEDPRTRNQGGVIDHEFTPDDDRVLPEFLKAVFQLEAPGEISDPIKVPSGYHIIKLLEIQPSRQLPYEEVKDQIIAELEREYRNSLLKQLRAKAYPDPDKINYEALKSYLEKLLQEEASEEK